MSSVPSPIPPTLKRKLPSTDDGPVPKKSTPGLDDLLEARGQHNKKIIKEIGQIVEEREIQQKATIVLGDFTGDLGYLGNQEKNMNGKLINKMIQEEGLILLNIDSRCEGTYTWQRGEQKSAIDLIMVNQCG